MFGIESDLRLVGLNLKSTFALALGSLIKVHQSNDFEDH